MATTRLSMISCRAMAARLAPIEVRMASSRRRAVPRVSSRLATLAQAISSRKPTAPSSSQMPRLVESRTKLLRNGSTLTERGGRGVTRTPSTERCSARIRALASASSTPSFRRAITLRPPTPLRSCSSVKAIGSQILLC